MWRLLVIIAFAGAPAYADITHKLQSSVQLTVDAAATNATRLGSSFSISGNGVDTTDGTTANTISAGTITSGVYAPGTISATQDTPGSSFSFSQSYTAGDAVPSAAPTVGAVPQLLKRDQHNGRNSWRPGRHNHLCGGRDGDSRWGRNHGHGTTRQRNYCPINGPLT